MKTIKSGPARQLSRLFHQALGFPVEIIRTAAHPWEWIIRRVDVAPSGTTWIDDATDEAWERNR